MSQTNIVVIGAGVSGLTTALLLSRNPNNSITIIAKHMPGDYDIEYASPWAGANYTPFGTDGTVTAEFERDSWEPLAELADDVPEAGIHFQTSRRYSLFKDKGSSLGEAFSSSTFTDPWYKNIVRDFRVLSKEELPDKIDVGIEYTSLCINTALYLPYLVGQCRKNGIVLRRDIVSHVLDAQTKHASRGKAHVVVNCTGLSSSTLGGVEDKTVTPIRGQTVLVRNDPGFMGSVSGMDAGDEEMAYFMTRASGGGTILGGSYQLNNWDSQPDPNLAARILQRAVYICPQLTGGKGIENLSIIRHAVGLRPHRTGGIRVEKEKVGGVWIVHNYGHGGSGYQTSYACSASVVNLVDEITGVKAKL